jgi:hypothetical protein
MAWTFADLSGHPEPTEVDAKLALSLRLGDDTLQKRWAA